MCFFFIAFLRYFPYSPLIIFLELKDFSWLCKCGIIASEGGKQQNSIVRILLVKPECKSKQGSLNIVLYACGVLCQEYFKLVLKGK